MNKEIDMTNKQELDVALNKLTYGFHIVSTRKPAEDMVSRDKDYLAAGTVSWLMQTSIHPPMITIALRKDSDLAETVAKARVFNIHILGKEDEKIVERFSGDSDITAQQINDLGFELSENAESPLFDCGVAILECEAVDDVVTDGDHMLFVSKVTNAEVRHTDAQALHRWETAFEYGGV